MAKIKKIRHLAALRDLGGIMAKDGRRIKAQTLFRSGHHGKLTRAEACLMKNLLNVSDIVDLRSPSELMDNPDVTPEGVKFRHLPSLSDLMNPSINKNNRSAELDRLMKIEGGTRKHMCNIYRLLATDPLAVICHRGLMRALMNSEGAVLWHCTQGKDRTGVATAIVLSVLGVERDVIISDYMLYNSGARIKNFFIYLAMSIIFPGSRKAKSLDNLLTAHEEYINAFFDEIDNKYGSMDYYIQRELRLSVSQVDYIRNKFLIEGKHFIF